MKIIFLDIDGVLNTPLSCIASGNVMAYLCPTLTNSITKLCEETGSKVVISSTWRIYHTYLTMHDVLIPYGLSKYMVCPDSSDRMTLREYGENSMWRTEKGLGKTRGQEIQSWIDEHEPENYVILDDDSDMLYSQHDHFVKIDGYVGITFKDWEKARNILDPEYKVESSYE